ncbi:hypothetical protein [Xanthomonas phage X1]|nr:hypothetical protein [Xanthomonas phage X1]
MKIKTLLAAVLMTVALSGCGEIIEESEIIPGAEAEMVAMCNVNGGFVRGWVTPMNKYSAGKVSILEQYRTAYHVECVNGAKIDKLFEGKTIR